MAYTCWEWWKHVEEWWNDDGEWRAMVDTCWEWWIHAREWWKYVEQWQECKAKLGDDGSWEETPRDGGGTYLVFPQHGPLVPWHMSLGIYVSSNVKSRHKSKQNWKFWVD
jgi:hypothetical protein